MVFGWRMWIKKNYVMTPQKLPHLKWCVSARVACQVGSSHFSVSVFTRYQIQPGTVSFGGNTFWRFCGNSFFEKFRGNSFFSSKGGRAKCTTRGPKPPLHRKKGAPANFLRGSRQIFDTENTDRVSLRYRYGKYREIPTDTDRKIPIRDATLVSAVVSNK